MKRTSFFAAFPCKMRGEVKKIYIYITKRGLSEWKLSLLCGLGQKKKSYVVYVKYGATIGKKKRGFPDLIVDQNFYFILNKICFTSSKLSFFFSAHALLQPNGRSTGTLLSCVTVSVPSFPLVPHLPPPTVFF